MVDVREAFPKGARVRINMPSVRAHGSVAIVAGYTNDGRCVKVCREGLKFRDTYHHSFLVLEDDGPEKRREAAITMGRTGGNMRAANLSPERLSEIGRQGGLARWGNRTALTPEGKDG